MEQETSKEITSLFDDVAKITDPMVRYVLISGINAILLHGNNFKDAATVQKIAAVVMKIRTDESKSLFNRLFKIIRDTYPMGDPRGLPCIIDKDTIDTDDDIVKIVEDLLQSQENTGSL